MFAADSPGPRPAAANEPQANAEEKAVATTQRLELEPPRPGTPFASPLAAQFEQVDPLKSGWQTEALGDEISHQLKVLGKLISHPDTINKNSLAAVATLEVDVERLRPNGMKLVFQDRCLVVARPVSERGPLPLDLVTGIDGMTIALRDLVGAFEPSGELRVTFKAFRVARADDAEGLDDVEDTVTSSAFYQATGMTKEGRRQQNATWHCSWTRDNPEQTPKLVSITVVDFEEVSLQGGMERLFSDCTESVLGDNSSFRDQLVYGIDHWRSRIEKHWGIEVTGYQGLALGDVNGDGLDDLYVLQPGGLPNRLFVQSPDGTATDRSAAAGVDWLDRSNSALFVDLDNDGDQDLVVATDDNLLFLANDGTGRFQRKLTRHPHAIPRSLCAADYDLDGRLDLFVCYATPVVRFAERVAALPLPIHDANNGARNVLYRNEGNWSFRDATAAIGLDVNNRRFSWAAAWEDYDNDGDQDLYVANDFGRNNLYRNDNGRFVDVAPTAAVEDSSAGMSVTWGDYNQDGSMDLYVGNMFSAAGNRIAYQRRFQGELDEGARRTFQRHARGNSLFENANDGTFRDVSPVAAVSIGRWAWGSLFADINNDGWEDLLVANGYVTQGDTRDL